MESCQRKSFYGYARGLESSHDVYSTKRILAMTRTLCINDIEDMLILVVQNRLTNLSGNDVSDFAIALENVQQKHGYSKESQRSLVGSRKRRSSIGSRKLMPTDELYKLSDGRLIRLRTLLDDITKNIRMEYLPHRRWSSLEKKRAHIMMKAIDSS
ncbi:hypothetical protein Tco_0250851 [Tanacetum coccineum]